MKIQLSSDNSSDTIMVQESLGTSGRSGCPRTVKIEKKDDPPNESSTVIIELLKKMCLQVE